MKIAKAFLLVFCILFFGCYTPVKVGYTDFSSVYDKESNFIDFYYSVFHQNDAFSYVYFSINSDDLLFLKDPKSSKYCSKYQIKYQLFNDKDQKNTIDSSTLTFYDTINYLKKTEIIDSFLLNTVHPQKYILMFTFVDVNKNQSYKYLLNINKSDYHNRQNYLIRNMNGIPVLKSYVTNNNKYRIICNNNHIYKLFISQYKNDFPVAQPPYVETLERPASIFPDSTLIIDANEGVSVPYCFKTVGIYQIKTDSLLKEGITVFRYYDEFPFIASPQQMLLPLKYIATKNEYNDMAMVKNTKSAIDNFWIEKAGSQDRAKGIIKKFYNRVQNANVFFSSYIEGWKTDRGLIYIVLGPPNVVYKSPVSETWIYGEPNNALSLSFVFYKLNNPFTDNDFSLARNANFKESWYAAVERWRK